MKGFMPELHYTVYIRVSQIYVMFLKSYITGLSYEQI